MNCICNKIRSKAAAQATSEPAMSINQGFVSLIVMVSL